MSDDEVHKLWDRTSTVNVQKLGCDIRDKASEHYDPIVADLTAKLAAKEKEVEEFRKTFGTLADKAYYEDSDFGRHVYNLTKYIKSQP
jgi:hypothetical protein